MANTERLAALAHVRTARNAIQVVVGGAGLADAQRTSLEVLILNLNDLEDTLILADLSEQLDALRQDGEALSKMVAALSDAAGHLAHVIDLVDTAAKAVGGLAQVVSLAVAHGLVS